LTTKKEPAAFLPTVTGNPDSFTGSDESITDVKKNTSSAETNGRKKLENNQKSNSSTRGIAFTFYITI